MSTIILESKETFSSSKCSLTCNTVSLLSEVPYKSWTKIKAHVPYARFFDIVEFCFA